MLSTEQGGGVVSATIRQPQTLEFIGSPGVEEGS